MEQKNVHAQALGRMGKGVKKTITPALIRRNKRAAKFPRPNRRKDKGVLDFIREQRRKADSGELGPEYQLK